MRLENYITHGEYLDTIELAYRVKKIYGINKKHIVESTLEDIRVEMANKRLEMLKVQEIQQFPF